MYKLVVFIPETHVALVKEALFAAGAGRIGDYDRCSWQVLGQGQFQPLTGSAPFLGNHGQVETVSEYRVEMVCADEQVDAVLVALRNAHPYEEPAFDLWRLEVR